MTIVRRPSDAPYTAAASPAGPAPTITVSYSAVSGSVATPRSSAMRRSFGRTTVLPPTTRTAGQSSSDGNGPPQCSAASGASGTSHLNEIWLRSRKCLSSVQAASQRCPTTTARGGGGSAAVGRVQAGEDRDPADLVRGHHDVAPTIPTTLLRRVRPRTSRTAAPASRGGRRSIWLVARGGPEGGSPGSLDGEAREREEEQRQDEHREVQALLQPTPHQTAAATVRPGSST